MLVNPFSTNISPAFIGLPCLISFSGSMPHPTLCQPVMTGDVLSQATLQLEIFLSSVPKLPKKGYLGTSQYLTFEVKPALLVKVLGNKYMTSAAYCWGCLAQVVDRYFWISGHVFFHTESVKTIRIAFFALQDRGPYDTATRNSYVLALAVNRSPFLGSLCPQ